MSLGDRGRGSKTCPSGLPRLFPVRNQDGGSPAKVEQRARRFCYTIAPGEDYYHRLLDGEIYLFKADRRNSASPCATSTRRGLLRYDPKTRSESRSPGSMS